MVKKVHRKTKFNQKFWLKLYIDTNTDLRKASKSDFEKYFSNLLNNNIFRKAMKNA